jgi:predicted ATPase/class 3 adenylate cyclase
VQSLSTVTTFLFTDIEGSTRLWEQEPELMSSALARHDAIARATVEAHRGLVVKMTGDGVHAAFDNPLDAVAATLALQLALADPEATHGIALSVRCGLHLGVVERRGNDFFGTPVNRAARLMAAAHGGQVLLSQAVVSLIGDRLRDDVTLRDLGVARLRDLASAEHVFQLVHPQLRAEFPALRSLEATPNNLPQQVTPFIGRERELAEIKTMLGNARLLTLVGVGGIGKTRLSLQVAADLTDDYPDGSWFVELAPLTDARLVPQAVASVLGVKEEAGHLVNEALLRYAKGRRMLLILDNCEHVVMACAELAKQLLQSGAQVQILASSREHLHIAAETTYPVPVLAAPDPRQTVTLAGLTQFEAVRLFIDRAVAAQPTFQLTSENAPAVVEICYRLDGIPLAIELAAARVRALSVEAIAARLSDRFRLLVDGDRTALPRQQTLRALIAWSYDLLAEPERALFRRLAVFVGGWTLEAADAVGAGGDLDENDVLDLLSRLVDKSLVTVDAAGDRYRLLETVRQYAQERLNESGEGDRVRARHLAFYLALAEKANPELGRSKAGVWLAQLDLERENFLLAHAWCDHEEGGAELGLRLAAALMRFWTHRGALQIGYRVTVEALTRTRAHGRSSTRCLALISAGQLAVFIGLHSEAQQHGEESLAIAREIRDKQKAWSALQILGMSYNELGDRVAALGHFEEALALAREEGPKRQLAAALHNLAVLHRTEGNLDAAEPLFVESLALAREVGDRSSNTAVNLCSLASLSIAQGSGKRAPEMLLEALEIAREIASKWAGQQVLESSAELAVCVGDWERAARLQGAVAAQWEQMGQRGASAPYKRSSAPPISRAREALGATAFAAAEATGRALSYDAAMAEAHTWLEQRS